MLTTRLDPGDFHNLLNQAQGERQPTRLRDVEMGGSLVLARRLIDETLFWQHQDRRLVAPLTRGRADMFEWPSAKGDGIHLEDSFLFLP